MESFYSKDFYDKIRKTIKDSDNILLISHLDADGLSSAGIISKLLKSFDKKFTVRIIKQLENSEIFDSISADLIIITDMGSGQLSMIKPFVENKKFIIIDHHQAQNVFSHDNLIHFNPGLNDDSYSGSTLSFLFASKLNEKLENLVHLGLVGAVGDMQYNNGFKGLNQELLDFGISKGYFTISKGLNIFGRVSKPLHEALAYSFDLIIPGITGNESGSIEFLSEINIDLKNENGEWKTLNSLNDNEMKKLVSNIIIRRLNKNLDSNILSDIININNEEGILSDLKEWSVMLNACGRQEAYSLGLLLCMGYKEYSLPLINEVLKEYKKLIVTALNLIKSNSNILNSSNDLLIVNGEDNIKDTIIGTVGGMILRDNDYNANTFIGFASRENDNLKVSCRTNTNANIGLILGNVCESLNCTGGGHKFAGGALIPKNNKNEFLDLFKKELEKHL